MFHPSLFIQISSRLSEMEKETESAAPAREETSPPLSAAHFLLAGVSVGA